MNDDQIKQEAIKYLLNLREDTEQAKRFVLDQAPAVLQELVMIGRVETTILLLVGALLCGVCLVCLRALYRELVDENGQEGSQAMLFVFSLITGFFGPVLFFSWLHPAITSWFLPRIYIIETLAGLLKH